MDRQKVLDIYNTLREKDVNVGLVTVAEVLKVECDYRKQKELRENDSKIHNTRC